MKNLKIATFNINKNDSDFPKRIFDLSDIIRKSKIDILCLQEDFNSKEFSSGKFLNLELDYNYISTKTREKLRNKIKSSSNLTILSRYPITLIDEVFFNKGKEQERAFQLVKITIDSKDIFLVNTHLCHLNSKNRIEQVKTILKKLDKYKDELKIICGDLNALPAYNEIRTIKKSDFIDNNNEFTHEDKVVLDYIFYKSSSQIETKSKIILKNYSDHYCLVKTFRF